MYLLYILTCTLNVFNVVTCEETIMPVTTREACYDMANKITGLYNNGDQRVAVCQKEDKHV